MILEVFYTKLATITSQVLDIFLNLPAIVALISSAVGACYVPKKNEKITFRKLVEYLGSGFVAGLVCNIIAEEYNLELKITILLSILSGLGSLPVVTLLQFLVTSMTGVRPGLIKLCIKALLEFLKKQ